MRNIKTEYFYETGEPSVVIADVATGICQRKYPRGGIKDHTSSLDIDFWRKAVHSNPINFKKITRAKARLLLEPNQILVACHFPERR